MSSEVPKSEREVALTERDVDLLVSLHAYRYLSISQLCRLHFPSAQTANRRARMLAGAEYVSLFRVPGVDERIAMLAEKGAQLVAERLLVPFSELGWNKKREKPKDYYFLKHFMAVNDFRIALTKACQLADGLKLVGFIPEYEGEVTPKGGVRKYIRDVTRDPGNRGPKITHTPDGVFALERDGSPALFFLEVDRGTEVLADDEQGFAKTILFYLNYLVNSGYQRYREDFGIDGEFRAFRVLVITASEKRLRNIRSLGGKIGFEPAHAKRFIWLAHDETVRPETVLSPLWVSLDPDDARAYAIAPTTVKGGS